MLFLGLNFPFCKVRLFVPALPPFLIQQPPGSFPHFPALLAHLAATLATGGVLLKSRCDQNAPLCQSPGGAPWRGGVVSQWIYKAVC